MTTDPTSSLVRLSISLPAELAGELDAMVAEREVANRSQMIAELIRKELAEHNARERPETVLAGTVTLIYRAESGRVRHALAQVQIGYIPEIISSQYIFLEDDQSLEVLLVQGTALRLQTLCDALRKIRGVQQIRLVTTTALLPPLIQGGPPVTSSSTADPNSARAHARAMAGTRVEAMPIVPAAAPDAPGPVVWEETVAPGGYATRRIARGTRLRLIDVAGDACASILLFNAENPLERLNVADTVKVQWNGYLGAGKLLLSDMGRVMMSILTDTAGTHDTFCGASNEASNARRYGDGKNYGLHPSARDRFMLGVAKHGLGRKDVHPCINLFKGVKIEQDGTTTPQIGPFAPGREGVLRAEMDLIVVLANCPHVLDPRQDYTVTPLRATAWKGAITPEADPVRTATPEGLRAFLNTEDFYLR